MVYTVSIKSAIYRKPKVVIIPTFSSLVAPEVVIMTTSGATSDDKSCRSDNSWFSMSLWSINGFSDIYCPGIHVPIELIEAGQNHFTNKIFEGAVDLEVTVNSGNGSADHQTESVIIMCYNFLPKTRFI